MNRNITIEENRISVSEAIVMFQGIPERAVVIGWLGQAGFAIRTSREFGLIDPYLSDALAKKYKGREFPHIRMMGAPVSPDEVKKLDWVLISHRHTDHMDPDTLPVLAQNNPSCIFILPRAEKTRALEIGLPAERIRAIDAYEETEVSSATSVKATPSAHEELRRNERGEHHFLGFILNIEGFNIYHSGDTVPFPGLNNLLSKIPIELAMLPVNGRDEYRTSRGVPGNMTLDEAISLCLKLSIYNLIPHHFGLFDFNTIPSSQIEEAKASLHGRLNIFLPRVDRTFILREGRP